MHMYPYYSVYTPQWACVVGIVLPVLKIKQQVKRMSERGVHGSNVSIKAVESCLAASSNVFVDWSGVQTFSEDT